MCVGAAIITQGIWPHKCRIYHYESMLAEYLGELPRKLGTDLYQ